MPEPEDPIIACLEAARDTLAQRIRDECGTLNPEGVAELAGHINVLNELLAFYKAK